MLLGRGVRIWQQRQHLLLPGATERLSVDLGLQCILEWCNAACKKPQGLSSEKVLRNVGDFSAPEASPLGNQCFNVMWQVVYLVSFPSFAAL